MRILSAAVILAGIAAPAAATIFEDGRVELAASAGSDSRSDYPPAIAQPGILDDEVFAIAVGGPGVGYDRARAKAYADWSSPDAGYFALAAACNGKCSAGANWQYSFFATGDGIFTMNWRYNLYKSFETRIYYTDLYGINRHLDFYQYSFAELLLGQQQTEYICLSDYYLCTINGTSSMTLVKGQHYRVVAEALGYAQGHNAYTDFVGDWAITYVPEPASWTLMIAGLGAVGFAMRRRAAAVTA